MGLNQLIVVPQTLKGYLLSFVSGERSTTSRERIFEDVNKIINSEICLNELKGIS